MDNSELATKATKAALAVLDKEVPGQNKGGIDDRCAVGIQEVIEKHLDRIRPNKKAA